MQCHGWSTAIRSFRLPAFRSNFTPKPARNASRFTFPTRPVPQSRFFGSAAPENAPARHVEIEIPPKLSPAALARAASQTIRMCAKEKQFGDALYILNSMRFSIYPPSSNPPSQSSKHAASTWIPDPKQERLQILSSTPSSVNGYTFIDFGQPVPTRLASHSFLHSLVKAGFHTKAANQTRLMMADGIRIHTKTMETILASTIDQSSYPPTQSLKLPPRRDRLDALSKYPITNTHTRIAVRLLEEARRRRQERTQRMYDVVINACLIHGEIIVASLLFIMVIKDWQLRRALKNQPPLESSEPLTTPSSYPTRQTCWSLLERIDRILTTRKDPRDPLFQNAIQALANLAFAVDTGQFPSRFMGSLIKALYSVPKLHVIVYIGPPSETRPVSAYKYIHQVLMRLVGDAGGKRDKQRDPAARRKFNVHAFNALLHYCVRHRVSKAHASDLLVVMKKKWRVLTVPSANLLLRSSTLLRDDAIRMDGWCSTRSAGSASITLHTRRVDLPLTRWARIINVLKSEVTAQYPSEPVIYTPATPDSHTVTGLITHLTVTNRGHIIAEKLTEIIPELAPVDKDGSWISMEERGRRAVSYGPYFFTTVLNALAKGGRTVYAELIWKLAVEAEKASWVDRNELWFLPIHAYTCMLQLYTKEGRARRAAAAPRRGRSDTRTASAMAMGKNVFRAVQARCQFLEAVKERDIVPGQVPSALRKFTPDKRYFNALLDLYGRRALGYAKPTKNRKSYWRWLGNASSNRFARSGTTSVHWHPMLAEIVAEMHKYGYRVPEGLRFLLVGRISGVDIGGSEPLRQVRPIPVPLPRQNPQWIPILKTRGLPVPRGRPRRRVRRRV